MQQEGRPEGRPSVFLGTGCEPSGGGSDVPGDLQREPGQAGIVGQVASRVLQAAEVTLRLDGNDELFRFTGGKDNLTIGSGRSAARCPQLGDDQPPRPFVRYGEPNSKHVALGDHPQITRAARQHSHGDQRKRRIGFDPQVKNHAGEPERKRQSCRRCQSTDRPSPKSPAHLSPPT